MHPNIFILMGVTASGKTTLGKALAEATGGDFFDGDDFHSANNLKKMAAGIPLTDMDRKDWLASIADLIIGRSEIPRPAFIACSALKQSHRNILRSANPSLTFLFLTTDPQTLLLRMTSRYRSGQHFMPPELLESQLATLEMPDDALELDSSKPVAELVGSLLPRIMPEQA